MTRRQIVALLLSALALALVVGALAMNSQDPAGEPNDSEGLVASTSTMVGTGGPSSAPGPSDVASSPVPIAPKGDDLEQIETPPPSTMAMADPAGVPVGTALRVTFEPYGIGPAGALVIAVVNSTVEPDSPGAIDLVGRNVLARIGDDSAATSGGRYTGLLTFQAKGDLLEPVLTDVSAWQE